jgi:ABC-type branched-subunit amino acid transport system ATPase component
VSQLAAKLSVFRDGAAIVREVELELPEGGALGLVGRNGAGKTTLIHGLLGMLPASGEVRYRGTDVSRLPTFRRAALGMALVPQGRRLFPGLTVAENLRSAQLSAPAAGPAVDPFELFSGLRELLPRRAGVLSGGQQQQVAIARALLRRPHLLFLDEPTEGLSPALVREVLDALRRLRESGLTIVLAEQHIAAIEEICTEVVPLRPGELSVRAIATSEFRLAGLDQLTAQENNTALGAKV